MGNREGGKIFGDLGRRRRGLGGGELEKVGPHLLVAVGAGRWSEAAAPRNRDSSGRSGRRRRLSDEGAAVRPG